MDRNTFLKTLESRLVEFGCKEQDLHRIYSHIQSRMPETMETGNSMNDLVVQILSSECHRFEKYDSLAVCFLSQQLEEQAPFSFLDVVNKIQQNRNVNGDAKPLFHPEFYQFIQHHADKVEALFEKVCTESVHFSISTFGWKTLLRSYLTRTHEGIVERPDHLWYRVALFLHREDWDRVESTFSGLRQGHFIHATPTLFSAGMARPQMASCFSADTPILTQRGLCPISEVNVGDMVLTHENRWRAVLQTHRNARNHRAMMRLQFLGHRSPVEATVDHPFYVYSSSKKSYQWKKVSDLRRGDWVAEGDGAPETHFKKHIVRGILYALSVGGQSPNTTAVVRGSQWEEVRALLVEHQVVFDVGTRTIGNTVAVQLKGIEKWFPIDPLVDYSQKERKAFLHFLRGVRYTYMYHHMTSEYVRDAALHDVAVQKGLECTPSRNGLCIREPSWGSTDWWGRRILGGRPALCLWSKTPVKNPEETVYTLGVEEDHSYVAGGVVVKNCFLVGTEDSVQGIYQTLADAAQISKWAGGLGIHVSEIRGKNSYIYGTNGMSNGIVPMLKVYNNTARYIDQGGGKRNGAFAMYLEPWHSDILPFLEARRNTGAEEDRARDLFYALWVPDLFMRYVEEGKDWYLMSPSQSPGLADVWGPAFETLYLDYVHQGKYIQKIPARDVWKEITRSQLETGTPYMLYKDSCNRRSNQQNLGTIRSSNLCCEIIQYSDANEYAVCNLASIALPSCLRPRVFSPVPSFWVYGKDDCAYCKMLKNALAEAGFAMVYRDASSELTEEEQPRVVPGRTLPIVYSPEGEYIGGFDEVWTQYLCPEFDFERLGSLAAQLVENLNHVMDKNAYPLEKCRISNMKHRPIGIGVQGLADVYFQMLLPYDSPAARQLNLEIFECLYFHALCASQRLAEKDGPYSTFQGSPLSQGKFHFELPVTAFSNSLETAEVKLSEKWDWEGLRANILEKGIRNSLLVAPMPTASTSQILGNTESFEPLTSNLYLRRTSAGEFYVCNQMLRRLLDWMGRWDNEVIENLVLFKGSVQHLPKFPAPLKEVFRTVWEIPQKSLINMAADRQLFIDQSQSFNIYLQDAKPETLGKIHFYGWKKGLKTGSYYVRTRAPISSQNFTIDPLKEKEICDSCSA